MMFLSHFRAEEFAPAEHEEWCVHYVNCAHKLLPEPSSLSSFSSFLSPPPSPFSPLLFSFPRVSEFEQQLRRERELAAVAKDLSEAVKDPEIQATKVKYE